MKIKVTRSGKKARLTIGKPHFKLHSGDILETTIGNLTEDEARYLIRDGWAIDAGESPKKIAAAIDEGEVQNKKERLAVARKRSRKAGDAEAEYIAKAEAEAKAKAEAEAEAKA